jgi:hypothetical protein
VSTTTSTVVEDREHALLSPSSAYTWIECAASTAAQRGQPDESSAYADEGTAAHELMKWCLDSGNDTVAYMGRVIPVGLDADGKPRNTFEVDEEMAEAVQRYVDAVRDRVHALELAGAHVDMLVEQSLSIEHITGEKDAKGTSDTILIATWPDGRAEIEVWDLKYGRGVPVVAERNYQAMMYAGGAYNEHSAFVDFEKVRVVIFQPRVNEQPSEWELTPADLLTWLNETAKPAAERALLYVESVDFVSLHLGDFNPGEKQCRFCKAKAVCPALAKHVEQTIGRDFEEMTDSALAEDTAMLDNERLGEIYPALPLIESWGKAVLARIEHELLNGNAVPGVKLVQGRKGARRWSDADSAEQLFKGMRLKQEQMYNFKLISPTQAEKLLARESPRRWKKVEALITQPPGSPSVAPESDKREALVIQPVADDFEPVNEPALAATTEGDDLL